MPLITLLEVVLVSDSPYGSAYEETAGHIRRYLSYTPSTGSTFAKILDIVLESLTSEEFGNLEEIVNDDS